MNKSKMTSFVEKTKRTFYKKSPEILMTIGITGMITTTVLAVKATPKAIELLKEAEKEKEDDLTHVEKVKTCWKCYAPAVATGVFSTACIIGANSQHVRRNAGLAAAYKISETTLREYRDKVVEVVGEKKEKEIKDKVNKDRVDKKPVSGSTIIFAGKGDTLCYDPLSDRYFKSDIDKIKRAENELNRRMREEMSISLNEFYDEIGLKHIDVGDDLGWIIDKGYIDINFSAQLTDDGEPCIVIDHNEPPVYNYLKYY